MVRALQFATIRAFIGIGGYQRIMRAAHVAAGAGHAVLLNGHVKPLLSGHWIMLPSVRAILMRGQENTISARDTRNDRGFQDLNSQAA